MSDIELNKETKTFLEELKSRPEVLGVILFGSRARGNNHSQSDVDLLVIVKEGYRRMVEYRDKQAFEIIYTNAKSALEYWTNNKDDCAGLWQVAKVLYDKDETIKRLKDGAEQIIKKGKKAIDKFQIEHLRFDVGDQLKAVSILLEKDPITANFILTNKVSVLTELFFDIRQEWTPAPKQRLAKIKTVVPELYRLLEQFYADRTGLLEKIEIAKRIVPLIFK